MRLVRLRTLRAPGVAAHIPPISGLDLDRNASSGWPNATPDVILGIPGLTSLEIGLELGQDLHSRSEWGEYGWNSQQLLEQGVVRFASRVQYDPRHFRNTVRGLAPEEARPRFAELISCRWRPLPYSGVPFRVPLYMPFLDEGRGQT